MPFFSMISNALYEYECKSVGYLVGEVEAVEDVVEDVDITAYSDEGKHKQGGYLFPYFYAKGEEEHSEKHQRQHSAGKVGKSLDLCGSVV